MPVSDVPSHVHSGWSTRERGRPSVSTVATEAHTVRWAISTKAGATVARSAMSPMVPRAAGATSQRQGHVPADVVDDVAVRPAGALGHRVGHPPAVVHQVDDGG